MISLENIEKSFSKQQVLKGININFREKEFVSILGPSGSGKTTLLNIIGALDCSSSGNVNLYSKKIKKSFFDKYRTEIGFIFQNYNLLNNLSVFDNISLASKVKNKRIKKEKILKIIKDVGLEGFENKKVKNLSGGQMQKVAIARALITNPKIIICDEPTGALDSKTGIEILELIRKLGKDKLVIMVTHDENLAKSYSDRIIRIKDGKVISDSRPYKEKLNKDYKLNARHMSIMTSLKLTFKNIKDKIIRNSIIVFATSIGIVGLTLMLSASNGVKKQINNIENNVLSKFPIIINKYASEETTYEKDKVYVYKNINHKNNISKEYLEFIKNIESLEISYIKDTYENFVTLPSKNFILNNYEFLLGDYPKNDNEVLLEISNNNEVSEEILNLFNIKNNSNINTLLGAHAQIYDKKIVISGVIKAKDFFETEYSTIYYNDNLINRDITSITIYPKDLDNRKKLLQKLDEFNNNKPLENKVLYQDLATDMMNTIDTTINSVLLVLAMFSIISLLISSIMIGIITYISILERRKEIGILRSLGARKKDIFRIFNLQNIILAIFSGALGIILSSQICILINRYIYKIINIKNILSIDIYQVIIIIVINIFVNFVGGYIPSKIASNKTIVKVLKSE